MAVSPIAFRHNLRLPTAVAHAQAWGVRPDLHVLHHFFPLVTKVLSLPGVIDLLVGAWRVL